MTKLNIIVFAILFGAFACKTQKVIPKEKITEISKSQDKLYLQRSNTECNILKGVCPTLSFEQKQDEYSIIVLENGIQYSIRRIENDSTSYSIITDDQTFVITTSESELFKDHLKVQTIIPASIYNCFKLKQNIKSNSEEELQNIFKHHQIARDTSYKYFIAENKNNTKSKKSMKECSLLSWNDYKNILISNYIKARLIADTISIRNEIELLKNLEKSVKNSYNTNEGDYSCLIPSKLFKNLESQIGDSLTEHIKFNYIAETIFMDEEMKQFVKTKPEIYLDLVDKYITNLRN